MFLQLHEMKGYYFLLGPLMGFQYIVLYTTTYCEHRLMGEDAGLASSVVKGAGTVAWLFA